MTRASEAPVPRPRRWPVALAAVLVLVAIACSPLWFAGGSGGANHDPDRAAQGAWAAGLLGAVIVLLVAALAAALGAAVSRQRYVPQLHEARRDRLVYASLLDGWYWQTDADLRVTQLVPPPGWTEGAPRPPVAPGRRLDERCRSVGTVVDGLQPRLAAGLPIDGIEVAAGRDGTDAADPAWRLCSRPLQDDEGRLAGHVGTLAPLPEVAPSAPAAEGAAGQGHGDAEAFSYTVSHDLRAPIRVVEGFTRIVKEDYGRVLDRMGIDHLDRVLSAAARMNSMIDALLGLSQLASQPLVRQPVDLSQLAGFVVDDLRRHAPERQVEVQIEPGLVVQGDPTLLRVVLENLLGNAWKYSGRTPRAQIRMEAARQDGRIVYIVRDNGAGFDMRHSERLFGVFQRLHSASEFPGTGVGLASVKRIVQRHGGDIWADGEIGKGAHFHFTLGAPRPH